MNLENYLSATLPGSVVSKIIEENLENRNSNNVKYKTDNAYSGSPAKRQRLDLEDLVKHEAENEKLKTDNFENYLNCENRINSTSENDSSQPGEIHEGSADNQNEIDDDTEFDETNLVHLLMHSFNAEKPRELLSHMIPPYVEIPDNLDNYDICRLIFQMVASEESLPRRHKLMHINTLNNVVDLIKQSKNIIVLTGAGCSVACGIPDFRSRNGIYARLHIDFPDLPDPQSMFDIHYFQHNPKPFFKFAKEIYPGQFKPSLSHMFIKKIEENNRLLRNYTQNIDTIELTADIKNVIQCHGSFASATCTNQSCKYKVNADDIREIIFNQEIPKCQKCNEKGILKPDIVFFGESLPENYHKAILEDKSKCDLLIVIGSSLKVKPVAHIPTMLNEDVPQILINRESLKHMNFDVELLGDCDVIVKELLLRLGNDWTTLNNRRLNSDEKLELIEDEKTIQDLIAEIENKLNPPKLPENDKNDTESTNVNFDKALISSNLKNDKFLYFKPNMYVFHGAEVSVSTARKLLKGVNDDENDDDDDDNNTYSESSSDEESYANDNDKESNNTITSVTHTTKNSIKNESLDKSEVDSKENDLLNS